MKLRNLPVRPSLVRPVLAALLVAGLLVGLGVLSGAAPTVVVLGVALAFFFSLLGDAVRRHRRLARARLRR